MQLVYATGEPGHFTFNVAPTPDRPAKERFLKRLSHLLFGLMLTAVACACLATAASAATFQVTTTADNGDNVNPTPGSLRKAILDANANQGPDAIVFQIQASGVQTISPPTRLPNITDPVTVYRVLPDPAALSQSKKATLASWAACCFDYRSDR